MCALYVHLTGDETFYNWTALICVPYRGRDLTCVPYRGRDLPQLDSPPLCCRQGMLHTLNPNQTPNLNPNQNANLNLDQNPNLNPDLTSNLNHKLHPNLTPELRCKA